jgi:hypothetical protein
VTRWATWVTTRFIVRSFSELTRFKILCVNALFMGLRGAEMNRYERDIRNAETKPDLSSRALGGVIALVTLLVSFLVFIITFRVLYHGEKLTALPEVAALFGSVDVSAQQWAFRAALIVLAAAWAISFWASDGLQHMLASWFVRPYGVLKQLEATISAYGWIFDRATSKLPNINRWMLAIIDAPLALLIFLSLAFAFRATSVADIYGPAILTAGAPHSDFEFLMGSDPHFYVILGRACEIMHGSLVGHGDPESYGLGGSLLYCGLRRLGFEAGYGTALRLTRYANYAMALSVAWCLWHYWRRTMASIWPRVAAFVALIVVIRPLLHESGILVVFANLSGVRYVPVILFLLIACCTTWSDRSSDRALRMLAGVSGFVLFPDTGALAAIGYAVMEGAQAHDRFTIVKRGATSLLLTLGLPLLIGVVLSYSGRGFGIAQAWLSGESSFGGEIVTWNGKFAIMVSIAVVVSTILVAVAGNVTRCDAHAKAKPIDKNEAIALATSIMIIAWIPFYLHRPYIYIIFYVLVLFPLSWAMQQLPHLPKLMRAAISVVLLGICYYFITEFSIMPNLGEILEPKKAEIKGLQVWSGLKIPSAAASQLRERLAALEQVRVRDALVVTGIPFAVAATQPGIRAPIEPLFTLGRERSVADFQRKVEIERPSMLIFDGEDNPAWGAQAIARIVTRIEAGLGSTYSRKDGPRSWRVWIANP